MWFNMFLGLWNLIFLGSNISLFLLLPFAYFFYEAEGLPGTKKVSLYKQCLLLSHLCHNNLYVCNMSVMSLLIFSHNIPRRHFIL